MSPKLPALCSVASACVHKSALRFHFCVRGFSAIARPRKVPLFFEISPAYFEYDNTWSGLEKKGLIRTLARPRVFSSGCNAGTTFWWPFPWTGQPRYVKLAEVDAQDPSWARDRPRWEVMSWRSRVRPSPSTGDDAWFCWVRQSGPVYLCRSYFKCCWTCAVADWAMRVAPGARLIQAEKYHSFFVIARFDPAGRDLSLDLSPLPAKYSEGGSSAPSTISCSRGGRKTSFRWRV